MEYQKIINLLYHKPIHPTKFITKNWNEINDVARETISGIVTVEEIAAGWENNGIEVTFKNYAPFTDSISEINDTQIDNGKDINVNFNSIEYSNNYAKTSGSYSIKMNQL